MQLLKTPLSFISSFTLLSALNHVHLRSQIPNSQLHSLHVGRCKHSLSLSHHSLIVSVTNRVLLFRFSQGLVNEQFVYHETARLHPLRRDALLRAVTTYCLASKGLFSAITILL